MKFLVNAALLAAVAAATSEPTGPIEKQRPTDAGCEDYEEIPGTRMNASGGTPNAKCCTADLHKMSTGDQWRDPGKTNAFTCASEHLVENPAGTDIESADGLPVMYISTMVFDGTISIRQDVNNAHKLAQWIQDKNPGFIERSEPKMHVGDIDCRAAKYCKDENARAKNVAYEEPPKNENLSTAEIEEQAEFYCKLANTCAYKMDEMNKFLEKNMKRPVQIAPPGVISLNGCGRKEIIPNDDFAKIQRRVDNFHKLWCRQIPVSYGGLETWQVILIVVAVLLFLAMCGTVCFYLYRKKRVENAKLAQERRYNEPASPRNQDVLGDDDNALAM